MSNFGMPCYLLFFSFVNTIIYTILEDLGEGAYGDRILPMCMEVCKGGQLHFTPVAALLPYKCQTWHLTLEIAKLATLPKLFDLHPEMSWVQFHA